MNLNIKHLFLPLIIAALTALCSCSHSEAYRIGVSQCSNDDWRRKMNEEIQHEAMFHDNVDIEIRSADDSNEKQIADLRYFADNGFDIIVAAPNEAEALTPVVEELHTRGIPVIIFDRTVNSNKYTAFQGADNVEIGQLAAQLAYSYHGPESRVIEIMGRPGSSPAQHRQLGFDKGADSLGITILARAAANWNYEDAYLVADSLLALYPNTNIIYAHNDRMAIGASDVARKRGLSHIKIIGIDAAPEIGIKAVADGVIDASFLYPTGGYQVVRTALDVLEGRSYDANVLLPTPAPVTADNAELLLLQYSAMSEEIGKMALLKSSIDEYWEKHSLQTAMLYGSVAIILLLALSIFLLLRTYWSHNRHRQEVERQNAELARQRDELDHLYNKLQEATSSKLTFFTNVSHDLRTPLTLIADPVQQLAKAANLTPQQHTLMQLADKNVKRLNRLINQILDIRKYDNGHLALDLANVDLAQALREWAKPFVEVASKKHIRLSVSIADGHDYVTAIDVDKIERVLFNLLSNSFKFTPENGDIRVELSRPDQQSITLRVADTGIGIKAEEISHIFERFFKTDQINPNGSGIGLALTKTFVDMHGGTITVESEPGKGTTFTVTLPVKTIDTSAVTSVATSPSQAMAEQAELADVGDDQPEVSPDAPTVLVIDDNPDITTLVKSVLSDTYTVLRASSGGQGIRLATKYVPDLIVCDVMMPGIDGYETCRRLKDESVTSHIPVLLLTACSLDEQRIEGYSCGADAYMSKPFDSDMLRARCQSLIDNRRRIYDSQHHTAPAPQKGADLPAQAPTGTIDDEFYLRFMALVERELGNSEISVEDIASELGLSRVQMYRKIKAVTNYSPAELLRNARLNRAARLLKTTTRTVSEICYEVGFTSPSYFTKCYKEYFNEAPTDTQARTSKME